ncbi:glycosyltransferase [Leuconostoc mesenteroides]|uniref:glycosyltransferase n=1 Tax=Leuconostoc mesenteroides TaxID=1245 RepID=UPI000B9D7FAF|nr:glycosyltransferase [Leuconostoc mesenteroides]USI45207.1 glycosyltransferase [Leuconostoc mesenteroides]BAX73062.1 glycosyltransferase, group 2 family protein [Leuconostoc mesenteroides]
MKTSVVLATYNGEKYIEKQLLSILEQTVLPYEIVITDDFSEDKTLNIVYSYVEKYSSVKWIVTHNKNKGFVSNFINGIIESTGDVVFLSDQDDEWKPNKIASYMKIFSAYTDAVLIHGDINVVDMNRHLLQAKTQKYKDGVSKLNFIDFVKKPNYPGMSIAFKKDVFKKNERFIYKHITSIKTHDFLLVMLSAFEGGVYTLGNSYCDRTFTGENVALREVNRSKFIRQDRINSAKTYINQYELILSYFSCHSSPIYESERIEVNKLLNAQKKRLEFLENFGFKEGLGLIRNVHHLPSLKSLVSDIFSK